jgi:putative ABC transport system permease protein
MGMRGSLHLENGGDFLVEKQVIAPGYFRALGIRLLRGRELNDRDAAGGAGAIVIGQAVAKALWPGEEPLGRRVTLQDRPKPQDWLTVVGVVDDIRQTHVTIKPGQTVYIPYTQTDNAGWLSRMTFAVRTAGDPAGMAPAMRAALRDVDPDQPIETLATMQDLVARTTADPLFQARLLSAFSVLALLLAAIGVYGVLAHAVAARTHEIGVRMALGAERRDVLRMVLMRTAAIAAVGVGVGTAGALAATRVLTTMLFEVTPTDGATFVGVALVLIVVSLAAGWIPARRATRVDPLVALRYE